jgi:hypothetical protein
MDQQENPPWVVLESGRPQKASEEFLAAWNEKRKSVLWTVTVESIVEKLSRCRQTQEDPAGLYTGTQENDEK